MSDSRDPSFSFRLIYIPTNCHTGADGLSHQPSSEHNPPEEDDYEDWLDNAFSFSVSLLNDWAPPPDQSTSSARSLPHI